MPITIGVGGRFTAIAVFLVLTSSLVVSTVVFRGVNQLLVQEQLRNLGDYNRVGGLELASAIRALRRDVQHQARLPSVREAVRTGPDAPGRRRLERLFAGLLRANPQYFQVQLLQGGQGKSGVVARRKGEQVVTEGPAAMAPVNGDWYRRLRELGPNQVLVERVDAEGGSRPILRAAVAVQADGGDVEGGVVIDVDLASLLRTLEVLAASAGEHRLYVSDERGDYLLHPGPGAEPPLLREHPGLAPLFAGGPDELLLSEPDGRGDVLHYLRVPYDPADPERFFALVLAASYEAITAGSREMRERVVLWTLLLMALGAAVTVIFSSFVTRPLLRLTSAAEKVAEGDYRLALPTAAGGEVGHLARAFQRMADQVQERGRALAERAEQLREANEELGQFAYVVSHDLKAPLRAVSNLSTWIEEDLQGRLEGESADNLRLLRERVRRMDAFIDALLQYSRAGRAMGEPEPVDSGALVHEVVESIAPPPSVQVVVADGMPTITADRLRLSQVFANLIGNAVRHAPDPDGRIQVACQDQGDRYRFEVRDNGPGIDPEHHQRIFDVFQTLESRDSGKAGTGMGLAIVKRAVESAGGKVWVESEKGKGAGFHFTWPKQTPAHTPTP